MLDLNPRLSHLSYSFLPAADDLLVSDLETKRFTPRPRRVEHLPVCQCACRWKPTSPAVSHRVKIKFNQKSLELEFQQSPSCAYWWTWYPNKTKSNLKKFLCAKPSFTLLFWFKISVAPWGKKRIKYCLRNISTSFWKCGSHMLSILAWLIHPVFQSVICRDFIKGLLFAFFEVERWDGFLW